MVENLKRRHGQHSSLLLLLPFLREKAYAVPLGKIFRQEILSRKLRALHNGYYIDSQQNPLLSPAYHTRTVFWTNASQLYTGNAWEIGNWPGMAKS